MSTFSRVLLSALLVVSFAACDDTSGAPDDASTPTDASKPDATTTPTDAGGQDAGGHDAHVADSGSTDPEDSGTTPVDAGPMDAGFDSCVPGGPTATAAAVCDALCLNVYVVCAGGTLDAGTCISNCLLAHADGTVTPTQRGRILACTASVSTTSDCSAFGACYSLANDCP